MRKGRCARTPGKRPQPRLRLAPRGCSRPWGDPVLEFLQMGGQHSDEEIIELVMSTCFDGLNARQA